MEIFKDKNFSFKERAADLVSRMTLEEKVTQVGAWTAAIPRLGLPSFHYANEASHGINALNYINNNTYEVTCFPVCLAMSQSWDREKIKEVTTAISDEARVYHNIHGDSMSFWAPTINIARDPRNGRSDENFGEDPFLAGKMAASYIQGMQGDDEKYLKAVSTPKHFMMNSSENNRMDGISFADEATQREYYARVFEYAFREGKAASVMISYNRINGVPAAANSFILDTLLREEWGFDGYVTSDCGAVAMSYAQSFIPGVKPDRAHYYFRDEAEACAGTLIAGTDLSCGAEHRRNLIKAVDCGLITEDIIDRAAIRNLTSLFRQGWFDEEDTPWAGLTQADASNERTHSLSVDMANDTIVLLKNEKNLLPLKLDGIKNILVVGPNARFRELGGYSCGSMNKLIDTPVNVMTLDGIRDAVAGTGIDVAYEKGWCSQKERGSSDLAAIEALPGVNLQDVFVQMMGIEVTDDMATTGSDISGFRPRHDLEDPDRCADDNVLFARALEAAKDADLVVLVAGTDEATASEGSDRDTLELPIGQNEKIKQMLAVNVNTVVVLTTLGTVTGDALDAAHTLVNAHFAGEAQGTAIANVLFGKVNPNAKLTATWYKDEKDLPHINDYGLKKQDTLDHRTRTYWYFDGEIRFPFGFGLSYTTYEYSNLKLEESRIPNGGTLKASVDVTNTGAMAGKEIVELYVHKITKETLGSNKPIRQLKGFAKILLKPDETKTVVIEVPLKEITFWNNLKKKMEIEPGEYVVEVGRSSMDLPVSARFEICGEWNAPISNVYCDVSKYVYQVGEQGQMKVSATLEDATHLDMSVVKPVFESSNPSVAVVNEEGRVTAVAPGAATISASVTWEGMTKNRGLGIAVKA
ncbi:MAG: glycoside hydrolase family 3 C-terminal domain-containing protein [Clostridiales bacterium]|nr:glycoside hydrolase family 3 C-terminal domain-containing protein [Clostridiales bacterium]